MKLGDLDVDSFKLGSAQVDKVYLGDTEVWSAIYTATMNVGGIDGPTSWRGYETFFVPFGELNPDIYLNGFRVRSIHGSTITGGSTIVSFVDGDGDITSLLPGVSSIRLEYIPGSFIDLFAENDAYQVQNNMGPFNAWLNLVDQDVIVKIEEL